jgi:8-amino-7-oxononanoate synthase
MRDTDFAEPLQQVDRVEVQVGHRKLLYFGGCDYHRLSSHPAIVRALHSSLDTYGLTTAASRKTTGNHRLFEMVEERASRYFGAERAVLLSSGYLANIAIGQGLRGTIDRALIDERCHGSLLDALQCIGCPLVTFRHRDPLDLEQKIAKYRVSKTLVVTDGLFAFDGSLAPLSAYRAITGPKPLFWVDDAHAAGVLGRRGEGSIDASGISRRSVIQTITFSKAFGVYGGAILCEEHLRRNVVSRSSAVAGNTPLPLPLAAGILQSLRVLKRSHLKKLSANVQLFWKTVGPVPENASSPIIAVTNSPRLSRALLAASIYPTLIRYRGGPPTGYFRFAISSAHTSEQVVRLAETIRGVGTKFLSPLLSR